MTCAACDISIHIDWHDLPPVIFVLVILTGMMCRL